MESKFPLLAGLTEKCPNSSWEQLSPFLPIPAHPCSFAGAWLSPRAAYPRQGQAVPGWQQQRQNYVRTRNHNPNIYSSPVYPHQVSSGIWLLSQGSCEEKPRKGELPTQVPGQLCGAEKFIPHKKARKKTHSDSHSGLKPNHCLVSWSCPICWGLQQCPGIPAELGSPVPPGVTAACGLLYLYSRLRYFQGYAVAAQGR